MKYSDLFHTKSRQSLCFQKISQELIILPLADKAKKKLWFFFCRILRNLVHAANKKGIIQNIAHTFYLLNNKLFSSLQSMCFFWRSLRGRISPIWGKVAWKRLLKVLSSKILISLNWQRQDEINVLKYYCTDNCTIQLVNSLNLFSCTYKNTCNVLNNGVNQ